MDRIWNDARWPGGMFLKRRSPTPEQHIVQSRLTLCQNKISVHMILLLYYTSNQGRAGKVTSDGMLLNAVRSKKSVGRTTLQKYKSVMWRTSQHQYESTAT